MKIHFVCTSNTYRSRLASTYLRSRKIPGVEVFSSGVIAKENPNGPITWYAERIIDNGELVEFMSPMWTQTTIELLNEADKIIFMEEFHLEYCKEHFGFKADNYEVWNVKDMTPSDSEHSEVDQIKMSEDTFKELKLKVDNLIKELKLTD